MKYLKCSTNCENPATWYIGTWQCCDECAKRWVKEEKPGWGYCPWGTASRAGQESMLKHALEQEKLYNNAPNPFIVDKLNEQ